MEANECETFHLDSDVLLPPRKRLLAGLKRQNSESTSQGSGSPESSSSAPSSEYNARLHKLLKSYKNGCCHMSPEEIAEAARSAAAAAAKAAEAARSAAEEKASVAVKAVAAAKDAMSLAARFSVVAGVIERQSRKNKLKKHVPVQHLYSKQQTGEELAHKLHRVINCSPERNGFPNAMVNGKSPCVVVNQVEDLAVEINGEAEMGHLTKKLLESSDDMNVNGRKRGRNKSFCSLKDRANPKDDLKESRSSNKHLSSAEAHINTRILKFPVH